MSKRIKKFDPHVHLADLISRIEEQLPVEPGAECQRVIDRIDAAAADFKRGVLALHRAEGDSFGIDMLLEDFERVARRVARHAEKHGGKAVAP